MSVDVEELVGSPPEEEGITKIYNQNKNVSNRYLLRQQNLKTIKRIRFGRAPH